MLQSLVGISFIYQSLMENATIARYEAVDGIQAEFYSFPSDLPLIVVSRNANDESYTCQTSRLGCLSHLTSSKRVQEEL